VGDGDERSVLEPGKRGGAKKVSSERRRREIGQDRVNVLFSDGLLDQRVCREAVKDQVTNVSIRPKSSSSSEKEAEASLRAKRADWKTEAREDTGEEGGNTLTPRMQLLRPLHDRRKKKKEKKLVRGGSGEEGREDETRRGREERTDDDVVSPQEGSCQCEKLTLTLREVGSTSTGG